MKIAFEQLRLVFREILEANGFSGEAAGSMAGVFTDSTFDGVFSHGINRFPRFIREVRKGIVRPEAEPVKTRGLGAMEQWDGRRGAGILNALRCTERAMELAAGQGIGCVGLRNTNHWMRGGTYGWISAGKGYFFLGWTNTTPNMPAWGSKEPLVGNNPVVMAIPREEGHIVADLAMSQYSYGKMEWYRETSRNLPEYGGFDPAGNLTKDPAEILESGAVLPIGLWKGSALSIVLDLAAALLSGGDTTLQVGRREAETGLSQVYICADLDRLHGSRGREELLDATIGALRKSSPPGGYPGEGTLARRRKHMAEGVEIPEGIWKEVMHL